MSYPLVPSAFDEIKAAENEEKIKAIQVKYEQEIKSMRDKMENKFQQYLQRWKSQD